MNKSNQRSRFFVACLSCMLIPLLFGFASYRRACDMLKRNAVDTNRAVLERARDLMDARYGELDLLCMQLYSCVGQSQLMHSSGLSQSGVQIKRMELTATIGKLMAGVPNVSGYYLYLKPIHTVITEDSSYANPAVFFLHNMEGDPDRLNDWLAMLDAPRHMLSPSVDMFSAKNAYRDSVTFYRSLPLPPYGETQGCVVLTVSGGTLRQPFAPLAESNSRYYVTDMDGNLLFSSDGEWPPVSDKSLLPDAGAGEVYVRDDANDEYAVISADSGVSGLHFYALTNTTHLYAALNVYRRLYFVLLAAILCAGTGACLAMALRAMRPVTRLIDDSRRMEQKLTRQSVYLSATFWEKLVRGEFASEEALGEALTLAGIRELAKAYVALDISLDQDAPDALGRRLAGELGEGVYAYQPKPRRIILCVPLADVSEDDTPILLRASEALLATGATGCIGAGTPCASLFTFYRSCFEAESAAEHARSAESHPATGAPYARYEDCSGVTAYLRPLAETSDRLLQTVMAGRTEETGQLLRQLRADAFQSGEQGYFVKLQIIYELRYIIIRGTSLVPGEHGLDQELLSSLSKLNVCRDPIIEYDELCSTLCSVCALREQSLDDVKTQKKHSEVSEYVDAHYADSQPSLRMVADHFDLNESYLSVYFKQNTGVNFADYLQQLRINCAIALLSQGDMAVADISQAVGYANDQTFRRAFKRVIGVSPTAYRYAYGAGEKSDSTEVIV